MSYGEYALIWFKRILLILFAISVIGMAITTVAKAKRISAETDAYCRYLDAKYGWDDLGR